MKKPIVLLCMVLCLTLLLSSMAFAAPISQVCISLADAPQADVEFYVYYVGTGAEDGTLQLQGDFAELATSTDLADPNLATTLSAYAQAGGFAPTFVEKTNSAGYAVFLPQTEGVYLVVGEGYRRGSTFVEPQPSLISFPHYTEQGEAIYSFNVTCKLQFSRAESGALTSRHVLKVWEDEVNPTLRPNSIAVTLLQDGVAVQTAVLSAQNNWSYTFDGLSAECVWSVVEQEVPDGYRVSLGRAGDTLVITNSLPEDALPAPSQPEGDEEERLPQTGVLLWPVAVFCLLALVCLCIALSRPPRKKQK